jgi:integrase
VSVYQRKSDWLWVATIEAGYHANGTRRRVTLSTKGCVGGCKPRCPHRAEIKKRLARAEQAIERGEGALGVSDKTTVKQWVDTYLELRRKPPKPLGPKGWNAAASPMRKWVIPTIGHKRLRNLTPADLRALADAQYDAGLKTATADATHRALLTALNRAVKEGHVVPQAVLKADRPGTGESDRLDVPLDHALACLAVASDLPHGIRWALPLLYGVRQGEALGLVEVDPLDGSRCVDFDEGVIRLAWQLQTLKYVDRDNKARGFEVPRDYVAVQLRGSYHLVRPKSKAGIRVLPMPGPVADALRAWLAIRPGAPHGLVFPTAKGTPSNDKNDREEWWAIQCTAGVGHPGGRWWHQHECRNLAATALGETGASDTVITSLLGHASILTSRGYMRANIDAKRAAVERVAERLGLGSGD